MLAEVKNHFSTCPLILIHSYIYIWDFGLLIVLYPSTKFHKNLGDRFSFLFFFCNSADKQSARQTEINCTKNVTSTDGDNEESRVVNSHSVNLTQACLYNKLPLLDDIARNKGFSSIRKIASFIGSLSESTNVDSFREAVVCNWQMAWLWSALTQMSPRHTV